MLKLESSVPLKNYSNFKIGGPALYFLEVFTIEELIAGLKKWREISKDLGISKNIFVLGGGTNILFSDEGFKGFVIKNSINGIKKQGNIVTAGAGTPLTNLLNFCIENSLSGLEWAGGLPGTVGGAVRGNAGAYNGETKDNVLEVESVNLETLETKIRNNIECEFGYRMSIFKKNATNEIITNIKFKLENKDKENIKKLTQEKIDARKLRHPLEYPNLGSIFKNVPVEKFTRDQMQELSQYVKNDPFPVVPTAKLNFLAGLKGKRIGDAQVSEKHTNFIINLGNATSLEVKELIKIIKKTIREKYNIALEEEIMYLN